MLGRLMRFWRLKNAAALVRGRLEQFAAAHSNDPAWARFPRGCGRGASELLGRYLIEHGHSNVRHVFGSINGLTHAWVNVSGIIVDITADQYGLPPVIVTKRSQFHSEWENEGSQPICEPSGWGSYPHAIWQAINQN